MIPSSPPPPRPDELEAAVTESVERIVARMPPELRADALRALGSELGRCLAEAPVSGDAVGGMRARARFSAALAAFDRGDPGRD